MGLQEIPGAGISLRTLNLQDMFFQVKRSIFSQEVNHPT